MSGKTGRRGHNEGGIYQRKSDGRWVGAVNLGWEGGKRKRKVVYGKTRAEVNQKVTRLLSDLQKGLPIQTSSPTVAKFLDDWVDQVIEPNRTAGTTETYRSVIDRHLRHTIGRHKIDKLTQHHVQALMNDKLEEGLSASMVKQIRVILRAALNQAMRWDLVHRNVAALAVPPKVERFEGYYVTPDKVRAIMAAAKGDEFEPLYAVATSVGLRQGELLGMRWCDVDFDNACIRVRVQLQVEEGEQRLVPLKSRDSRRTVPLLRQVATLLRRHRTSQLAKRLEAGVPWSEEGTVFAWPNGAPISDSYLRLRWYRIREAAGLPSTVRFHDLRGGALSILAARGTPPRTLKGIAGHANTETTMKFYAHLDDESVRASVDLLRDLYEAEKDVV